MATPRAPAARRLPGLFHAAREPVFLLDPAGRFTYVNPAWEALVGAESASVLGREAAEAGDAESGPGFAPTAEALAGEPSGTATLIVRPGGERTWRRVEFWPFRDGRGEPLGMLGLVRDPAAPAHAPESASRRSAVELAEAREGLRQRHGHAALVGRGPRHDRLCAQVDTASRVAAPALIVGEPGTGKRLVARVVHERGPSAALPFVIVDLAALGPAEVDRQLFDGGDHLAARDGSTLLLHGLERLPRDIQARLVPALRRGEARVLATATAEPAEAGRDGVAIRDDLYYALSGLVLRLAPLRDRIDEVPLLAQHFLDAANRRDAPRRSAFAPDALDALGRYDWPGNLAELARVVQAAHARAAADPIVAADLPPEIRGELASAYAPTPAPAEITPLDDWLARLERRMIEAALARARRNKSRAAELLDISRPRLYRRIKELGIPDEGEPGDDGNGAGV